MTDEAGDFRMIIINGVQHRDRSKLITAEETESPRWYSTAIQSERTRRRSP